MVQTTERLTLPCWLCQKPVDIKFSVKEKPYLVCDIRSGGCGMQTFLREDKAIKLLQNKVKEGMQHE
jgi:endogenous inhibitor of DNA gyrase (YacG/DUF329 family)